MTTALRTDPVRLWDSLMRSAAIGATEDGGLCRLALSDEDRAVRDWFAAECTSSGAVLSVDPVGSMFARFPGSDPGLPPIAVGSHLDTQPTGGRFDGILGVLGGLEMLRTLRAAGHITRHPIEIINWTNEEGARFSPAMVASGAFAGVFAPDFVHAVADRNGLTIGGELARIGYAGTAPLGHPIAAYFELHIEQGPVLEAAGLQIGAVTGVQGMRWFDVAVRGTAAHAGTTPMALRRDALAAATRMAQAALALAETDPPRALVTIGCFEASPGSRNTVPSDVHFTVDLRHEDTAMLDRMEAALGKAIRASAVDSQVAASLVQVWNAPPVVFDPACVADVQAASAALGFSHRRMLSGAGHDAAYVSRVAPAAMIFTPCRDGISHNPAESITPEQAAAGADVLLHAVLRRDARGTP